MGVVGKPLVHLAINMILLGVSGNHVDVKILPKHHLFFEQDDMAVTES